MSVKPVLAASANESVLFPAPASPVTTTRRPMADRAVRTAVSIAHMPAPWSRISADHRHIQGASRAECAAMEDSVADGGWLSEY